MVPQANSKLLSFFSSMVDAGGVDCHLLDRRLIVSLLLLNHPYRSHAINYATKYNIFLIHESEWCAQSDVELALVCVCVALAMAHSEEAWFVMLLGEAFISKLTFLVS